MDKRELLQNLTLTREQWTTDTFARNANKDSTYWYSPKACYWCWSGYLYNKEWFLSGEITLAIDIASDFQEKYNVTIGNSNDYDGYEITKERLVNLYENI